MPSNVRIKRFHATALPYPSKHKTWLMRCSPTLPSNEWQVSGMVRAAFRPKHGLSPLMHGAATFHAYAPRLHAFYEETLSALQKRDSSLTRNFSNSVFGSITFNLGPQTVTQRHTDFQNLPAGWCAITAAGNFDPTESAHIILWELKLVIEFPPGSTILIPSAVIHHSNTTLRPHETRYSITQYSAGGLFRWVECGFMSQKDFDAKGLKHRISGDERWKRGLEMFSTWSELSSGFDTA